MNSIEAGPGLEQGLSTAFILDVHKQARRTVRDRVTPRDWDIFLDLEDRARSPRDVATLHGMNPTAVIQVRHRVNRKLEEEVLRLIGAHADVPEVPQ